VVINTRNVIGKGRLTARGRAFKTFSFRVLVTHDKRGGSLNATKKVVANGPAVKSHGSLDESEIDPQKTEGA